jgi:aminopeptidase N
MTTESIQKTIYLKDYQSPFWCISHVRLHISIGSTATEVTAELDISRANHTPPDMPLRLHGADLELLSLEINAQSVDIKGLSL